MISPGRWRKAGRLQLKNINSIVQIPPELTAGDELAQILIAGGDQAKIGGDQRIAPETRELLLL